MNSLYSYQFTVHNSLTGHAKKTSLWYRDAILRELSDYIDRVRRNAADKQIIPRMKGRERRPYQLRKLQPSTPGRLTERTGALIKMLKDIPSWSGRSTRILRSDSDAMQAEVKVTTRGIILEETYEAVLKANIKNTGKYSQSKSQYIKQQLFMRFRWETGIRGQKRPILNPAGEQEYLHTESLIKLKLAELR